MPHPLCTSVTLGDHAICRKCDCVIRTYPLAMLTSDTGGCIIQHKLCFFVFIQASGWAGTDTRCILAVHTAGRKISHLRLCAVPFFDRITSPIRQIALFRIQVILIHAGYRAGAAINTSFRKKLKSSAHDHTSTFSILHRNCLNAGNPEYGSSIVSGRMLFAFASSNP